MDGQLLRIKLTKENEIMFANPMICIYYELLFVVNLSLLSTLIYLNSLKISWDLIYCNLVFRY